MPLAPRVPMGCAHGSLAVSFRRGGRRSRTERTSITQHRVQVRPSALKRPPLPGSAHAARRPSFRPAPVVARDALSSRSIIACVMAAVALGAPVALAAPATSVDLGTSAPYGVLSGASIGNVVSAPGAAHTTVHGGLAVAPAADPLGFPPGIVTGSSTSGTPPPRRPSRTRPPPTPRSPGVPAARRSPARSRARPSRQACTRSQVLHRTRPWSRSTRSATRAPTSCSR